MVYALVFYIDILLGRESGCLRDKYIKNNIITFMLFLSYNIYFARWLYKRVYKGHIRLLTYLSKIERLVDNDMPDYITYKLIYFFFAELMYFINQCKKLAVLIMIVSLISFIFR